MAKAEKGDLIRIVKEKRFNSGDTEDFLLGAIYEVDHVDADGYIIFFDRNGDTRFIYDHSQYVIHRKAGEEDEAADCDMCSGDPERADCPYCATGEEAQDAVNPQHYKQGRVEVIDIIEDAVQGADPFEAVCQANIIKYSLRYRHKNGVEDLRKSVWYTEKLIAYLDAKSTQSTE